MNDHDILVEIHTMVKALDKCINGNGRPGLLNDFAKLSEHVDDIEARSVSKREKTVGWTAITVAFIAAASSVAVALVG